MPWLVFCIPWCLPISGAPHTSSLTFLIIACKAFFFPLAYSGVITVIFDQAIADTLLLIFMFNFSGFLTVQYSRLFKVVICKLQTVMRVSRTVARSAKKGFYEKSNSLSIMKY